MKSDLSSIVYSKNAVEFITVANEYCKFVESAPGFSQKHFVERALNFIPLLYLKASLLEKSLLPWQNDSDVEGFRTETFVTEVEYYAIENSIKELLGDYNEYPEVFESQSVATNEATLCFISEDLADIYQDLKNGLQNYRNGVEEIMLEALLEVAEQFKLYWGQRIVNALRPLHNALYNGDLTTQMLTDSEEEEDLDDDLSNTKRPNWLNDRFDDNENNPFAI